MNPYLDADLLPAKGKDYGAELYLRKTRGIFTVQLSYTWSRSLISDITPFKTEQINEGEFYSSNSDRPSNLSLTGGIRLGSRMDLCLYQWQARNFS